MKPRLKSTSAARELIKAYEPFAANAHQNGDGSWVVGYGHHAAAKAGVSVSQEEAELLLVYDVLQAEQAIDESIGGDIGTPQRDALVSFALGIGLPAFRRSAVVRLIRKHRWHEAADAIAAWDGGGIARHEAERALFMKELPEDADRAPVELIIEFDHPADDDEGGALTVETEEAPQTKAEFQESEETEPVEESDTVEDVPPASEAPVRLKPGRSALAERVILRMQTQISGPVRERGYAPAHADEERPASTGRAARDEVSAHSVLGFAYTQSVSIDDDDVSPDECTAGEGPPIVGVVSASTDGLTGEVAGAGGSSAATLSAGEEEQPLAPSDIDPEFVEAEGGGAVMNGWSNGDSTPAPGKNGGHLGEIILLTLGLALLGGGVWDLSSRLASEEPQSSLFFGLSAVVAGFIFAAGAAIWLFGSKKK